MTVKLVEVIAKAWYDNKLLTEGEKIDFVGDKLPSWCKLIGEQNEPEAPAEEEVEENLEGPSLDEPEEEVEENENQKVGELPLVEKNLLLEEAKKAGVTGNLLGFKVSTLKAKIAKAQK